MEIFSRSWGRDEEKLDWEWASLGVGEYRSGYWVRLGASRDGDYPKLIRNHIFLLKFIKDIMKS